MITVILAKYIRCIFSTVSRLFTALFLVILSINRVVIRYDDCSDRG